MADVMAVQLKLTREITPLLRGYLRRGLQRSRAAILPRKWVIQWEMKENSRYYARAFAEAKARKASPDDLEGLKSVEAYDHWTLEEERDMLESNRLLRQASTYMLPTPEITARDDDPNWRQGISFKPNWYLTAEAMQRLRTEIRAERKARREPLVEWVKVIGELGGVIYLVEKAVMLLR